MVILTSMTIIELATGLVAVCGAVGAVIHNSRCSKISCCGIFCEREVIKINGEIEKETELPVSRSSSSSDFDNALELKNKIESKV